MDENQCTNTYFQVYYYLVKYSNGNTLEFIII